MFSHDSFRKKIFSRSFHFEESALELFRFQAEHVKIYKDYISLLNIQPSEIKSLIEIPFLPVSFFKTHKVISDSNFAVDDSDSQTVFTSSGTTGPDASRHYVNDISLYEESFTKCFNHFYGAVEDYCILALLPSYMEREGSSLIYMTDYLIRKSKHPFSGFYLNEISTLIEILKLLFNEKQKTILLGVTYALLDLADQWKNPPGGFDCIIMETGGMKGKRKEMIREEVHTILCKTFGVKKIHSEYGMTELLSQAYSYGDGIFQTPAWMKILIRDINDTGNIIGSNQSGGINVIDLANIYSCAFIASQDLGRTQDNETFEVLGRFDESDLRGCNLLVV